MRDPKQNCALLWDLVQVNSHESDGVHIGTNPAPRAPIPPAHCGVQRPMRVRVIGKVNTTELRSCPSTRVSDVTSWSPVGPGTMTGTWNIAEVSLVPIPDCS